MKVGVVRGPQANASDMMTYQDASGDGVEFTMLGTVGSFSELPPHYMRFESYPYEKPEILLDRFDILDVPDPLYPWARWFVKHHPCVVVTIWENLLNNMIFPYGDATRADWEETLDRAALVVARSPLAAASLREFGVAPEKIRVIPAAVDTQRFKPGEKEPGSVLYIGRITWEKGIYDLLMASRGQPWDLTIVGKGASALGESARNIGFEPALVEAVSHEETAAFYARSEVFVYPSLPTPQWQEQFGISVIEAAASECALVLSHQASFDWFAKTLPNVYQFSPGDWMTLRSKIKSAQANSAIMGDFGPPRPEAPDWLWHERFGSQAVGKQLKEAYAKLRIPVSA